MKLVSLALVSLLAIPVFPLMAQEAGTEKPFLSGSVLLATADGLFLKGFHVRPDEPSGSVILLHTLGKQKEDWQPFVQMLAEKGFEALALDLRGHGESRTQTAGTLDWKQFSAADFRLMIEDVDAAWRFLEREKGRPRPVFLAGAGLGANLALIYAVQNEAVAGAILLSPGIDYRGVRTPRYMQLFRERPVLVAVSSGDDYPLMSSRTLMELAPTKDKLLKVFPEGAGQGIAMLDDRRAGHEDSPAGFVLDWLAARASRGTDRDGASA